MPVHIYKKGGKAVSTSPHEIKMSNPGLEPRDDDKEIDLFVSCVICYLLEYPIQLLDYRTTLFPLTDESSGRLITESAVCQGKKDMGLLTLTN